MTASGFTFADIHRAQVWVTLRVWFLHSFGWLAVSLTFAVLDGPAGITKPELALSELADSMLKATILGFASSVLLGSYKAFARWLKVFGLPSRALIREMHRVLCLGGRAHYIRNCTILVVWGVAFAGAWWWFNIALALPVACACLALATRGPQYWMPPSVLVLGRSSDATLSVFLAVYALVAPLRTLCLLEPGGRGLHALDRDVLRLPLEDWEVVCQALVRTAPVVIIDLRDPSPAVARELAWVGDDSLKNTVVVVAPDASERNEPARYMVESTSRQVIVAKADKVPGLAAQALAEVARSGRWRRRGAL